MARSRSFDVRRQAGFPAVAITCFILLYLPIILLVIYSFNAGKSIAIWEGFSLQWYVSAWENEKVQDATIRSLIIATCASLLATSAAVTGGAGDDEVAKVQGLFRRLRHDQSASDDPRDRHRRRLADLLRHDQGRDRLHWPLVSDPCPLRLLHPLRLYADPGAAAGDGSEPGAGGRRPLRHALARLQTHHAASALARRAGGRDAGLCHLAG